MSTSINFHTRWSTCLRLALVALVTLATPTSPTTFGVVMISRERDEMKDELWNSLIISELQRQSCFSQQCQQCRSALSTYLLLLLLPSPTLSYFYLLLFPVAKFPNLFSLESVECALRLQLLLRTFCLKNIFA